MNSVLSARWVKSGAGRREEEGRAREREYWGMEERWKKGTTISLDSDSD